MDKMWTGLPLFITLTDRWAKQTKRSQSPAPQLHHLHPIAFSPEREMKVRVVRTLSRARPPSCWQTLDLSRPVPPSNQCLHPSLVRRYLSSPNRRIHDSQARCSTWLSLPPLHCLHLPKNIWGIWAAGQHICFSFNLPLETFEAHNSRAA